MATITIFPDRLSDQARRHLWQVANTARDAADHAAAYASVGDVRGLLLELRRGVACQLSAIHTLEALAASNQPAELRRAA